MILPSMRCSMLSYSHTSTRVPACRFLKITFCARQRQSTRAATYDRLDHHTLGHGGEEDLAESKRSPARNRVSSLVPTRWRRRSPRSCRT